jgi:D-alanine-D-alanine ligase
LANLPYVGCGVEAAAIGMDKLMTKVALRAAGVPVLPDYGLTRARWQSDGEAVVEEIEAQFPYPIFVKPVSLGSSIGVAKASDRTELQFAIDVAATYDSRVMIEPAQENIYEINCSVLGDVSAARASVCEHPISAGTLSYDEKYLQGGKTSGSAKGMSGAKRVIPADIPEDLTRQIQETAVAAFKAIGAAGVSRIDFLVHLELGEFYVNEINTLPGSLSFYLWEPSGLPFPDLLNELIRLAQARNREKRRNTYAFDSALLRINPLLGSKAGGAKTPAQ